MFAIAYGGIAVEVAGAFGHRRHGPDGSGAGGGAAGEAGVAGDPRRRVDAGLQAQGVDVVAQALHVGEFFVRLQCVIGTAAVALPGVVDVDVGPAVLDQAAFGETFACA